VFAIAIYNTPLLGMNYGLTDHEQLKLEVPWVVQQDHEKETVKNGLGGPLAGVKWRFIDEETDGLAMSIYPQPGLNSPTSSAHRGLIDSGTEFIHPFEIAKAFGQFELGGEVGFDMLQHNPDRWFYGLAAGYRLIEQLEIIGEVRATSELDFAHNNVLVNGGTRWKFSENVGLVASIGTTVARSREEVTWLLVYVGLQFTF
jgi:hypothetical protein